MATEKQTRQGLIDSIKELGSRAFSPESDEGSRGAARQEFDELIQRTGTIALMPALNIMIRPDNSPAWLRPKLLEVLTLLPLRPDGVRATLEFVFAVHPSSTIKTSEAAAPQKQGANITHEALNMATRLLSVPPAAVTPETWYSGIAPQLFKLLDGQDGHELIKVISYVVGFGILGRRQYGAPGTAGWKYFAEPLLSPIRPPSPDAFSSSSSSADPPDAVIDLSKDTTLVSPTDLAKALYRLQALLISHPNPGLCKRLLGSVMLQLWALSTWQGASTLIEDEYCTPSRNLLKIFLRLDSSTDRVLSIIRNLVTAGGDSPDSGGWLYKVAESGGLEIVRAKHAGPPAEALGISFGLVDEKVNALVKLLGEVKSDDEISEVFLVLFGGWIRSNSSSKESGVAIRLLAEETQGEDDLGKRVIEVKLLQKMMTAFSDKLVTRSDHALELISGVFRGASAHEDEAIPVALSLLNMVVTAPRFKRSQVSPEVLEPIETRLASLAEDNKSEVSITARNLSLLLKYRDELQDPADEQSVPTDRQVEDRKTYNLAMSYITQADSPPPVRSEGINLIFSLVVQNSPILDIPVVLVLMSSLLSDEDEYVHLRVIKVFVQLANKHPQTVVKELLEHYVDAKEAASVDTRLRFGEALLQVIQRLGETFTGETAKLVGEAMLSTAGRRGHRPKTQARQAKEERTRALKNREAEEAWDGQIPDLSDEVPEDERARNAILESIVGGWESKRGTEDIRIRSSALSIFGSAMETNIVGLGPNLVSSAVDLCINILTIESELEKLILRRSAVIVILSFVRALDEARQAKKSLGFGLTSQSQEDILRVLKYIADTDNDGLVQQHAKDVVESLENWQLASLVPTSESQAPPGLTQLAGLSVNIGNPVTNPSSGISGPRIQEIE